MRYNDYENFKYYVQKEYIYYSRMFQPTKEDEKKTEYYKHLLVILDDFERQAIKNALRTTGKTKQDFLDECTKDFE